MGTVHGVYLKYVGLSALSYAGLSYLCKGVDGVRMSTMELLGKSVQTLSGDGSMTVAHAVPALCLAYSTAINGLIAVLFKTEWGMSLLGKNRKDGTIPWWSYLIFFPFHVPTRLYTAVHTEHGKHKKNSVPVATEVQPGWWVGGCYSHELAVDWAAVVDLTVEFPETSVSKAYLSLPTWDGVPATPSQLEEAAAFAVKHSANGHVLVHCAHGRGRSTTVMCACLVKAGLYYDWEEAFAKGIKPKRPVCKLNRRMKQNLAAWQAQFVHKAQ